MAATMIARTVGGIAIGASPLLHQNRPLDRLTSTTRIAMLFAQLGPIQFIAVSQAMQAIWTGTTMASRVKSVGSYLPSAILRCSAL